MSFVIDTHALIWHLENHPRLGRLAKSTLDVTSDVIYLPSIVLVEACWIVEIGKTTIDSPFSLFTATDADRRIQYVPMASQNLLPASVQVTVPVGIAAVD